MSVIETLFSSFFGIVTNTVSAAEWLAMLLIAAFCSALVFNIIHVLTGGK